MAKKKHSHKWQCAGLSSSIESIDTKDEMSLATMKYYVVWACMCGATKRVEQKGMR